MKKKTLLFSVILLITALLTAFFYLHETFPKPLRAITALFGTPVAVASGLSYYLTLGIEVYDSPVAVVLSNLVAAIVIVVVARPIIKGIRQLKSHKTR